MNNLPLAETQPYWKTSKSGVETWLDKTEKLIEKVGGKVDTRIVGKSGGREGILFAFFLGPDQFKMSWPALPTKKPEDRSAALRQAATMIYHDTKARINRIEIFGAKVVFADWYLLPSGKTLAESNTETFSQQIKLLG